ncbi:autotransporter-associated beta strand repeat-containing protein, partial [Planktomarina sp.]|nr:autotransporter-associated beta strand repeat-containing protein [Planktomarina sp.]
GIISGAGDIAVSGAGTLTLSGNNTFSGGTVLNSGSLNLGSPGALSTVGTVIFNGGVLQYSPSNQTDYSGRFSTASNQVYKIDTNSEDVTFSAPLNSAGTLLEKIGEGKLIFSDLSRFTAGGFTTTISGGDLVLPTNDPSLLTANSLFSGAGTLRIEPISPSFGSNITLSSLSFGSGIFGGVTGSTFGSLVLGKSGNAVDLLLDGLPSNVSVNSDQTYYGSEVTVPSGANVGVRRFAGGTLSLIAQTDIHIYDTINVTGAGGVILKTSQDTAVGGTGTYDLGAYYDANTGSAGHLGKINFDGTVGQFFKTQDGSTAANLKDYTLASSLDVLKDGSRSGYFALSADINAASFHGTDANSNPVYYSSVVDGTFTGIFAGLGHEISNLQLTNAHAYTGMFAQTSSATIQDIALSSFSVSAPNHFTGSLVGRAHGTVELAGIILKNSSISSPNHNYIGGLIGYSDYGTILNSWIINTQVAGHYMTGGIAGRSLFSTVTNVHNVNSSVTATGNHHTGGLFGDMYNQTSTVISNSSSSGNITSNQQQVGGLVGRFSGSLVNSYSTGDVYGSDYVGGLVGVQYNTQTHTGIYSTGDVTASVQRSGGLFGQLQSGGTILNSYASGTIKQISHAFAGGLVGINEGGQAVIFDNSYFDGDVIGNGYLGGIIGSSNGPTTIRNGSYVSASLIQGSGAFIGGLVGISNNTVVIKDSYVTTASINASDNGNKVGGLVGQAAQVQAENTYVGNSSAGGTTITSRHLTGGLVGKMSGGYIRNAYFKGTIDNTSHNMSQYGGIVGHLTPGSYLSNVFYNIDATQINGAATATMAGIYNDQYNDWFNSYTVNGDHRDIASKALDIDAYLTKSGDYYLIQTVQDGVSQSDLSDMLGFTLSTLTGSANAYKFKLTADLDMSVATTPFIPYFSGAELIGTNSGGSDFHVNNFSWAQSTSNVGFLGFVQKSLIEDITVNTVAYSGQSVGQTNSIVGADYVGAVMGSMYQGKIHNVHAVLGGAITADNYVGGIVGFLESAPMGVVSATRLSGVGYDASLISASNDYVGGIGGRFINTAMKEIDVDLNVSGRQFVGGVAGYAQGNAGYTDAFIEQGSSIDIHSTATSITASSGMVGGLFGEAHSGTNGRDWSTTASVTGGSDYVGGL